MRRSALRNGRDKVCMKRFRNNIYIMIDDIMIIEIMITGITVRTIDNETNV